MGGSGSRVAMLQEEMRELKAHYHGELTVRDREFQKMMQQNEKQLQALQDTNMKLIEQFGKAMKNQEIKTFDDLNERHKDMAQSLTKLAQQVPAAKVAPGLRSIGFFGTVSCGKSTTINSVVGKKVANVGRGECTRKVEVYPLNDGKTVIVDVPGTHASLNYFTLPYISLIKGLTKRVVVVEYSLKASMDMVKLLVHLKLPFTVMVNLKHPLDPDEEPEDEFRAAVQQEIKEAGAAALCEGVFLVNAKRTTERLQEWLKFVNHLSNGPSREHRTEL